MLLATGTVPARCPRDVHQRGEYVRPAQHADIIIYRLANGTVLAPQTKLMWMRCLLGQTLTSGLCTGTPSTFTWPDALNAAKAQTFAGYNDWRLPNVKELLSILEDRCWTPALNADLFPIPQLFTAWSSTPSAVNLANEFIDAWVVDGNGYVSGMSPVNTLNVLLVRDAP